MSPVFKRILFGVIALGALALMLWPKFRPQEESASALSPVAQGNLQMTVNAHIAGPETIQDRIFSTGVVLPNEIIELSAETSGKITDLLFEEGASVSEGDLLLKINDSELQAQLKSAQLRLELARDIERRQRSLFDSEGLSRAEYDVAANELSVAEAAIQLIQAQIDKTELRAPFSGVVGLRYVSEGSYITPQSRIATLQDIDPVKIEFSVPERHANRARIGDRIRFTVEGYSDRYSGVIYAIEPTIQQDSRSLRLRARSPNLAERLLPGSFANVEMIFAEITDAIAVPSVAIIPELGGSKVYLYRGGTVVQQQVRTGLRLEDRVQITNGVAPGDTILTSGIQQVFPGMPVQVRVAEPTLSEVPTGGTGT